MVENARFVNVKLLTKKLGAAETNIVPNMFARFVFPRYGFRYACMHWIVITCGNKRRDCMKLKLQLVCMHNQNMLKAL